MKKDKKVPFYITTIASLFNSLLFAPLELSSTRSKSINATTKSFKLLKELCKNEGTLSMWKGSSWFILSTGFSRSIWLTSYNKLKINMENIGYTQNYSIIVSSYLAGLTTAIISNPFWTLKSYSQLPNYPGFNTKTAKFFLNPKVLMSGVSPAMIYIPIESLSQLFIYEKLKKLYSNDNNSPFISGIFGGISRTFILPFSYPLHIYTLRLRENVKPIISFEKESYKINPSKETFFQILKGIHQQKSWYNGLLPYAIRVSLQSTSLFFIYESFKKFF